MRVGVRVLERGLGLGLGVGVGIGVRLLGSGFRFGLRLGLEWGEVGLRGRMIP